MEIQIDGNNQQTQQPIPAIGRRKRLSRGGFAMVLVLLVLSLVAVTATYFMASAGRERRVAEIYADGNRVRMYTDATVNLVMGLINTATREGVQESVGGNTVFRSWASQPGMIRTFTQSGQQGANTLLSRTYKLYSWSSLITEQESFDPNDTDFKVPDDWASLPAVFVDINEPSNNVFPIADPRASIALEKSFFFDENASSMGVVLDVNGTDSRLPMPVQWLYILEDGTFVAPEGGDGTTARVPGAETDNPIVGRVAFWTDDETCKVNINTASEGSYWDWPKGSTRDEMQFAGNPPLRAEFQRIAGHPANTSISAVFPELEPGKRWVDNGRGVESGYQERIATAETLNPRIGEKDIDGRGVPSGSRGGTHPVSKLTQRYNVQRDSVGDPGLDIRISKNEVDIPDIAQRVDRLFPTSDEVVFQTRYNEDNTRADNVDLLGLVDHTNFTRRQFFMTTNSRSPETTLFETPRISLWPITWPHRSAYFTRVASRSYNFTRDLPPIIQPENIASKTLNENIWMTPEEKLLAFASTLNYTIDSNELANEHRFFFQRQNPDSPTHDINRIPRNKELLSYLYKLGSTNIPGFGSNFRTRGIDPRNFDLDSVMVKAFDYSRAQINQYTAWSGNFESQAGIGVSDAVRQHNYSYTGVAYGASGNVDGDIVNNSSGAWGYQELAAYSVVPIRVAGGTVREGSADDQHGMGSFPKLSEVAIMFYGTSRREPEYIHVNERTIKNPEEVAEAEKEAAEAGEEPKDVASKIYRHTDDWIKKAIPEKEGVHPDVIKAMREKMAQVANGPQNPENWRNLIFVGPDARAINTDIDFELEDAPTASQTKSMRAVLLLDFTHWASSKLGMTPTFWVKINDSSVPITLTGGASGTVDFGGRASQVSSFIGTGAMPEWSKYLYCRTDDQTQDAMAKGMGRQQDGIRPAIGYERNNIEFTPEDKDANYWTFVSLDIQTDPDREFFGMDGGRFIIELYGVFSDDVDTDPTEREDMMIARYIVDFRESAGTYAIPLMPYWVGEHRTDARYDSQIGEWIPGRFGFQFPRLDADNPGTTRVDNIGYQSGLIPRPYSHAIKKDGNPVSDEYDLAFELQDHVNFTRGYDLEAGEVRLSGRPVEDRNTYIPPMLKEWQVAAARTEIIPDIGSGMSNQAGEGGSVLPYTVPNSWHANSDTPYFGHIPTWGMQTYQYYAHPRLGERANPLPPDYSDNVKYNMYLFSGDFEKRVANSVNSTQWGADPYRSNRQFGFQIITPYDTVISMIPKFSNDTLGGGTIEAGSDPRLLADGAYEDVPANANKVMFTPTHGAKVLNFMGTPALFPADAKMASDFPGMIYSWGFQSQLKYPVEASYIDAMSTDNIGPADTIFRSREHRARMAGSTRRPIASRFTYQHHNLGRQTNTRQPTGFKPTTSLFTTGSSNIPMALYSTNIGSDGSGVWAMGSNQNSSIHESAGSRRYPFSNYLGRIPNDAGGLGDWTILPGDAADGGIIQRPDQEYQRLGSNAYFASGSAYKGYPTPYFQPYGPYASYTQAGEVKSSMEAYFSPNRQVPSPVILGTLPSSRQRGWQTLAFNPNPFAGIKRIGDSAIGHPGTLGIPPNATTAGSFPRSPDHLLLDFFWMPVCEPYPISDQFSTAGKVNLNYQMMPFTYIKRQTALHAALKSTWMYGMSSRESGVWTRGPGPANVNRLSFILMGYKNPWFMSGSTDTNDDREGQGTTFYGLREFSDINNHYAKTRYAIDVPETIRYLDMTVFNRGDIFRSASQLCEAFLIPDTKNSTLNGGEPIKAQNIVRDFWNAYSVEGFNVTPSNGRQEPYNHIYSRITTKSNTYTVHWRVQSLRKLPGSSSQASSWDENRDRIVAESRGSTLIERYIDPNARNIPDYATMDLEEIATDPLSNYYKWRIVANTKFNP